MLINGINLNSLGIKLYDRVIYSNQVNTVEDWLEGDIQPTEIRQQDNFKRINLSFLILGVDEDDSFLKISKLTQLVRNCQVQFDDLDYVFSMKMTGQAEPERLKNGNFIVRYEFTSDYAKGDREIYTTNANLTNSFKLTVLYYKNQTQLLATDIVTIRAANFEEFGNTISSIGIEADKYKPNYYNTGVATNIGNQELTYENLQQLRTLIINYTPIVFNSQVQYFISNDGNFYEEIVSQNFTFTQSQIENIQSLGQLINVKIYQPEGYKARIGFSEEITVENILAKTPIPVYYTRIANEHSKNVTIVYKQENDEGEFDIIDSAVVNYRESQFSEGMTLEDVININRYRPSQNYYNEGYIYEKTATDLIDYESLELSYEVRYSRAINNVFVEYYYGTYPDWYRITTTVLPTKYKESWEESFSLEDLNLDLDKFHTSEYLQGQLYNSSQLVTYEDILNFGVLQVYYTPIDFTIQVVYQIDGSSEEPTTENITINALDFIGNPVLNDIIPILENKPEGYQFSPDDSYQGEISLAALTQLSPITITYVEIEQPRLLNVVLKYKQQLASTYGTMNTSVITINEADTIGGVRLRDLFNLDLYRPQYYEQGYLDGASVNEVLQFDQIKPSYSILYDATSYTTPVRYYTDEVDELNWIGSSFISYRVIDFTIDTNLYDLGLNINLYKPSYGDDGQLQYTGPVNFNALRELTSINVVYETVEEPGEDEVDYPHRFLFLQHNDMGDYESQHPNWTMNHAYINTGVSVEDMSKLTVIMECKRVDENVPLHNVNVGYAYLFGSASNLGSFYMRFNNQTQYGNNLTGVNTYEAQAGLYTEPLVLTEARAIGWGENSGIYANERPGYSSAVFTYTNTMQSEAAQMPYPLYLFAINNGGRYYGGLAGIGIYGCKIYYGGTLIRDFIPVQFYDKIKDKVAPSNCLYDKITETFFEDATGQNSFNIIDDDRYTDTNLEHKIGVCYVQYFKGDAYQQTVAYYFRASEFVDQGFDPYTKFLVDEFQPAYYEPGYIENFANIVWSFDNMNNQTFKVIYEEADNYIEVNYYKENSVGTRALITTERIALTEKDFYLNPTFGDIVRINKYLGSPEPWTDSYASNGQYYYSDCDYVFPEDKVTLTRVLRNSPYDIVYKAKPIDGAMEVVKSTTITFIRKVYGVRNYKSIAIVPLSWYENQIKDGEYLDFYVNKNQYMEATLNSTYGGGATPSWEDATIGELLIKDVYKDGEFYQWFEKDVRLSDELRENYYVVYEPKTLYKDINYYTDDIDDENLIGSTTWSYTFDMFEPNYVISVIDTIPNEYVNRYKPITCAGGRFETTLAYGMYDFINLNPINIWYESLVEPHDPESASYEQKILYWESSNGKLRDAEYLQECIYNRIFTGGKIPYIDLGYRPKEIGRLRVEFKGYARPSGIRALNTTGYGFQTNDYTYFFGYYGPLSHQYLGTSQAVENSILAGDGRMNEEFYTKKSAGSSGCFALRCRVPLASGWVYTAAGPQFIDGQTFYTGGSESTSFITGEPQLIQTGIEALYRKGYYTDFDDELEPIIVNNNYGFERTDEELIQSAAETKAEILADDETWSVVWDREHPENKEFASVGNPYTIILDAYNKYGAVWRDGDSNTPLTYSFDESNDPQYFEDICQPRGTLSLFQTTNPMTGKVNIMPFNPITYPYLGISGSMQLSGAALGNPYSFEFTNGIEYEITVYVKGSQESEPIPGTGGGNSAEYPGGTAPGLIAIKQKVNRSILYASYQLPVFPQMTGCAVWHIKIYDRDRLVRDLIPVAQGDIIYDYEMPENGLFDLQTEIFFGNQNQGGSYHFVGYSQESVLNKQGYVDADVTITPQQVYQLQTILDPTIYGKIVTNYYDYDNTFINNQYVDVPCWYNSDNDNLEDILKYNDFKPDDFHLDGMLDLDQDISFDDMSLKEIYDLGTSNVYYKLKTYTKTIVYYQSNTRVGSRDVFFSLEDIRNANSIDDLDIDVDYYYDSNFKHGRIVFDDSILESDDMAAFIDAPSPVVIYDKFSYQENPNILYLEYFRGGAYDDSLITVDNESINYLDCNLSAAVLNPHGAIKYYNHYHTALYEDEVFDYFIPYQVEVVNKFTGIYRGPGRRYQVLAMIVDRDYYTIIEERNGWGRLKEYPIGWILLNQTRQIVGPGQNPEYDVAGQETATIPFMSHISITKMTVDRLWCYCPAQECWLKTEDISFDQQGKLYSGLAIEVIDLDQVNWQTANTLSQVGIEPNKWALRFHDYSGYVYSGQYTREAFSLLHSIEFVYPETIYNYSCIYYRDNKDINNILGRSAFSCSISDWNPDWDTFIATSWRYDQTTGRMIEPSLYRDTELILTWDYFGFDRNLFKPTGYFDGIYLWNSRTWDKDNRKFTFRELIKCGTQYVVYPVFDPNQFKLVVLRNQVGTYSGYKFGNPGVPLYLGNGVHNYFDMFKTGRLIYDIYTAGEWNMLLESYDSQTKTWLGYMETHNGKFHSDMFRSRSKPGWWVNAYTGNEQFTLSDGDCFIMDISNNRETPTVVVGRRNYYTDRQPEYYIATNEELTQDWQRMSFTKIDDNTNLAGPGYDRMLEQSAISQNNDGSGRRWAGGGIDYYYYPEWWSMNAINIRKFEANSYAQQYNQPSIISGTYNTGSLSWGCLYETMVYDRLMMIHYYIPAPKGMRYRYNGEERRIQNNCMFDLLTGNEYTSFKVDDGQVQIGVSSNNYNIDPPSGWVDGRDYIFLRNQEIDFQHPYSVFDYEYNDIQIDGVLALMTRKSSAPSSITVYREPDRLSAHWTTWDAGVTGVVSGQITSGGGGNIDEVWYKTGIGWIPGEYIQVDSYTNSQINRFTDAKRVICMVPKKNGDHFYGCQMPMVGGSHAWQNTSQYYMNAYDLGNQPGLVNTYYYQDNEEMYFDGHCWIYKEYTSKNVQQENQEYVVANDIDYYQYPIESPDYILGSLYYGERITVLYSCVNDDDWCYIGNGWIRREDNLAIVE